MSGRRHQSRCVEDAVSRLVLIGVALCLALVIDKVLFVLHSVRFVRWVVYPLPLEERPTSHHVLGFVQRPRIVLWISWPNVLPS